jgi:hypothetical protein
MGTVLFSGKIGPWNRSELGVGAALEAHRARVETIQRHRNVADEILIQEFVDSGSCPPKLGGALKRMMTRAVSAEGRLPG